MLGEVAAGCVALSTGFSCRCVKVNISFRRVSRGMNCHVAFQNLRQDVEKAFDALAVFDTRLELQESKGTNADYRLFD